MLAVIERHPAYTVTIITSKTPQRRCNGYLPIPIHQASSRARVTPIHVRAKGIAHRDVDPLPLGFHCACRRPLEGHQVWEAIYATLHTDGGRTRARPPGVHHECVLTEILRQNLQEGIFTIITLKLYHLSREKGRGNKKWEK